jgi:hypothetical protein
MLAQPAERIRIWESKLTVLSAAFLSVFAVWLAAFAFAYFNASKEFGPGLDLAENSYNLFIAICLIAAATFTGGLWTTLLLRQMAGAFWLTLLVPITLLGFSGVFLADSESYHLTIAVLSVVIGVYSLAGFLFARWLFFRAQDVGWSGGVITLPEWKFLAVGAGSREGIRQRKPIAALILKEIQLQQGVLTGAVGLLGLHVIAIGLRAIHKFSQDSLIYALASSVWLIWFVLPVLLGSLSVTEERKLGLMETQFCLPSSRRIQFLVKACVTLGLGIVLGGLMPALLESAALALGLGNSMLAPHQEAVDKTGFVLGAVLASGTLALAGFFASSLTKNFLQAIGLGLITSLGLWLLVPAALIWLSHYLVPNPFVSIIVMAPVLVAMLAWLAYLNFVDFRSGWPSWRRQLLGLCSAGVLTCAGSAALYHRAWEFLLPAEPAHGAAKLSLADPPRFEAATFDNLLVRLPDGRVWFDYVSDHYATGGGIWEILKLVFNQMPHSAGPAKFIPGSNWVNASVCHLDEVPGDNRRSVYVQGYTETIGLQKDGTLWASDKSAPNKWTAEHLAPMGNDSDWQQLEPGFSPTSALLLKKDGTLWGWGTNRFDFSQWPAGWPGLKELQPYQLGSNSDWVKIYGIPPASFFVRKTDGSLWRISSNTNGLDFLRRMNAAAYDPILQGKSVSGGLWDAGAFVRADGTLWMSFGTPRPRDVQIGSDTNWIAVACHRNWLVALKSDGTLWRCSTGYLGQDADQQQLVRLGTHNDWVSLMAVSWGVVTLAADGSLWFWPDRSGYQYSELGLAIPKRPQFIANVFSREE